MILRYLRYSLNEHAQVSASYNIACEDGIRSSRGVRMGNVGPHAILREMEVSECGVAINCIEYSAITSLLSVTRQRRQVTTRVRMTR